MSEDNNEAKCCASCGVVEVDDVKLKNCNACYLVRYCSVKCQKEHRPKHKRQCKKRAAELRDELLFKQPERSHVEDCPICCLPMSLDQSKSGMQACCSKVIICHGCAYVNTLREAEASLDQRCPFCRTPVPTKNELDEYRRKRIEANDPVALHQEGLVQDEKGDYSNAFEYYTKAAELGHVEAHGKLAHLYNYGHGVEKDREKEMYHFKEASIGGHPIARHNLGCHEERNGNIKRAVKHWIIAATQGHDSSIEALMSAFKGGEVRKDVLAAALRAHKTAVDATKSPQREAADEYYRKLDSMHSC